MEASDRTFENIYRELEETVRRLETGDLSLAESVALFERGTKLAEQANLILDQAELRVQQLTSDGDMLSTIPFEG